MNVSCGHYRQVAVKLKQEIMGVNGVGVNCCSCRGSQVLGIIPTALAEGNFAGKIVEEELKVPTMQDRIWKMLDNSDGFIALPSGTGTLEENFQIAS
ncbi:hypothetical protein DITRI_Ditri20bG0119200 [Diplodiscus trichospermus]